MSTLRGFAVLTGFMLLTIPLMPVQAVLLRISTNAARRFPNWYHRKVCRLLGITLKVDGAVATGKPVLLVCNHTSWLDIPVLSALAPLSFVAKLEVGGWPFVSSLARLQRSVFVDRTRRQASGEAASEIMSRLKSGDTIVLFAEGTSSNGHSVLPFKTSLFGAVLSPGSSLPHDVTVQSAAVVYTHQTGLPLSRADRPRLTWFGDMEMTSHAWRVLKSGPIVVTIKVAEPVPLDTFRDRKDLAFQTERRLRGDVVRILRGRLDDETLVGVEPSSETRRQKLGLAKSKSDKWT